MQVAFHHRYKHSDPRRPTGRESVFPLAGRFDRLWSVKNPIQFTYASPFRGKCAFLNGIWLAYGPARMVGSCVCLCVFSANGDTINQWSHSFFMPPLSGINRFMNITLLFMNSEINFSKKTKQKQTASRLARQAWTGGNGQFLGKIALAIRAIGHLTIFCLFFCCCASLAIDCQN